MIRLAVALAGLITLPALAQEGRYVTFKTVRNEWGVTQHQINRSTIRQEGAYKTFWSRVWLPEKNAPLAISVNERLLFLEQKFAVDCARRRFASTPLESMDPRDKKADLKNLRWSSEKQSAIVVRAVCGVK